MSLAARAAPLVALFLLAGCVCRGPCSPCEPLSPCGPADPVVASHPRPVVESTARSGPTAIVAPAKPFAFYDGSDGSPSSLEAFLDGSKDADLVAFGEMHGDPVGAAMELKTLEGMAAGARPVALAMEFFERDVQGALDSYLAGKSTEAEFLKVARQGPAYAKTHRALIEFAKAHHLAVIAANAPKPLVTAYRKSDAAYADYLASLSVADRAFLPAETTLATGPYLDRWSKLMGPERGPRLLRGQCLWDDAMADAIAKHRAVHPDTRVLLIVGGFHVTGRLGTLTKFSARRPSDRVRLLVMGQGAPPALAFDPDDKGEGDAILLVPPPAKIPAPKKP